MAISSSGQGLKLTNSYFRIIPELFISNLINSNSGNTSARMASSKIKSPAHQASLSVYIGNELRQLTIFRWLQVCELKTEIFKATGIPVSEQRLFNGHVELSNSRSLEDYSLFDPSIRNKSLVLEFKRMVGSFMRLIPGTRCNSNLAMVISEVNQGLKLNLAPTLTWDGTGGTYLMKDAYRNVRGVFKPIDEEPYAPMNPRGYIGRLKGNGIRPGILSGEAAYREVAAYLLDYGGISGVPPTALVESQHQSYNYSMNMQEKPKEGSFQEFIANKGAIEDFSPTIFKNTEVQKIAILDIRILNMDRNEGNILVTSDNKLIPIDHGQSIPDCLDINEYDLCWMNWQSCKEPIDDYFLEGIQALDPVEEITFLKEAMPFRDRCLRNLRISNILLKKGANAGLTLAQIGALLYRPGFDNSPSVIEQVVAKSIELYKTINKSLSSRLKLEQCLSKKITTRPRAYSTNESDFNHFGDSSAKTQTSTPGEPEFCYELVMVINEVKEEEDDDGVDFMDFNGRSLSLPSFVKLHSKTAKEKHEAFDRKLFYYVESFIELAVQKKVKDLMKYTNPNGRLRSSSDFNCEQVQEFSLY